MTAKFTPGPWGATGRKGEYWDSVVFLQRNPNMEICQCFHSKDKDECTANANLLAAAPELYTELKAAIGNLTMAMLVMDSESRAVAMECIKEHKKVLAKADGGAR
jgi:hypothetical protein